MNCPSVLHVVHMVTVRYDIIVNMKDMNRLTYGRTSVYNLNYHLIWGTKYRNKVLKGHVEAVFREQVREIANKYGSTVAHMEIGKQGRHLWLPSYYVESIGAVNEKAVAKYIDDQRKKEK